MSYSTVGRCLASCWPFVVQRRYEENPQNPFNPKNYIWDSIWIQRGRPSMKNQREGQRKRVAITRNPLEFLAPRPGLEPGTYGLTVRRSTN